MKYVSRENNNEKYMQNIYYEIHCEGNHIDKLVVETECGIVVMLDAYVKLFEPWVIYPKYLISYSNYDIKHLNICVSQLRFRVTYRDYNASATDRVIWDISKNKNIIHECYVYDMYHKQLMFSNNEIIMKYNSAISKVVNDETFKLLLRQNKFEEIYHKYFATKNIKSARNVVQ